MSAAALDIQAVLNRQDVSNLVAQMDRARRVLGLSLPQSVRFGAWAVAGALGTATRIAPKRRKIEAVSQGVTFGQEGTQRGKIRFRVTSERGGRVKTFMISADSAAAAKQHPRVKIARSGLAKASWGWPQRKLGRGAGAFGGVTARARTDAERATRVVQKLSGENPFVEMHNRLGYVEDAMRGGARTVESAFERAAKRMVQVIDAKAAKVLGMK
jgi:hypothetical protein